MANTRWLARLDAVSTIIDQYDALKLHFQMAASTERCFVAMQLSNAYNDPQNFLYMFVRKVTKQVVDVNRLFQSEYVDVTKLTSDLLLNVEEFDVYGCVA